MRSVSTQRRPVRSNIRSLPIGILALWFATGSYGAPDRSPLYDLVISGGRVMDPQSGLDGLRNVGIADGRIAALTDRPLRGRRTIDARGLVVAPGFIDLHSHAQDPKSNVFQAHDGVTTALELELGVFPVEKWYSEMAGRMVINYGATVSHTAAHAMPVVGAELLEKSTDPFGAGLITREMAEKIAGTTLKPDQNKEMAATLQRGIDEGALGIGMGIQYLAGVDKTEVYRGFEVAARNGLTVFVHQRSAGLLPPDSIDSLQELLADAAATGAGVHVCHIGSSGMKQAPLMIEMIDAARAHGVDVTTEVYPYPAGMAVYGSPLLAGAWRERFGIDYGDLESVRTHERLTEETFKRGRAETPEDPIVVFMTPQETVDYAVAHPSVIIASDAVDAGRHPRTAGTFSRVLGLYVRERHALSLMHALEKMTIMPARRLEQSVPQMASKGRIKIGADADITVFDADKIIDAATFDEPAQFSRGILHVLVGGVPVVRDGKTVEKTFPGQPVRRTATANAAPPSSRTTVTDWDTALHQVDAIFDAFAAHSRSPGLVYGIVRNGQLAHTHAAGVQDVKSQAPVTADTVFRMASLTKSFTALAVLKLRDEGRLDINAPATRYVPQLHVANEPRLSELLNHSAGFVTDDPWADRELDMTEPEFTALMSAGTPLARPPAEGFEYSNLGYAVLGRAISNVSGQSYQRFITQNILQPLGMSSTVWERGNSSAQRRAIGYSWIEDHLEEEPALSDGAFGAVAGLSTTANDYARYVAWLLSAWDSTHDAPAAAIDSSLVREAGRGTILSRIGQRANGPEGKPCPVAWMYGAGFYVVSDCELGTMMRHPGGLPGFGAQVLLLPHAGIGIFAFANLTYAHLSDPVVDAAVLLKRAGLVPERKLQPGVDLLHAAQSALRVVQAADIAVADADLAPNVLLDESATRRNEKLRRHRKMVGACASIAPGEITHALFGKFELSCERGKLEATIALAPASPSRIQYLEFEPAPAN